MAKKPAITVKVPKERVVKALGDALAKREDEKKAYEKATADYEKATAEWEKKIKEMILAGKIKLSEVSFTEGWRGENPHALVKYDIPATMKKPKQPQQNWALDGEIEELKNAIALLKLSDDEQVSTSTYAGVARFIS